MTPRLRVLRGDAIAPHLDVLAALRIEVFRDWPYLYDGDAEYERRYLAHYAAPGAVVVAAFDGEGEGAPMVGAATAAPMEDHDEGFADALVAAEIRAPEVYYLAESVLLPEWRGRGLGHRFFDLREAEARTLGRPWAAFCAVIRLEGHPARPEAPRELAPFWRGRGYAPVPGALARFSWRDVGDDRETEKPLQLWLRRL
jgi:GNAT superfamily N-acetyltransferase